MPLFASTFVSGASDIVRSALHSALPDVEITRLDDGIVLYRTEAGIEMVQALRFFQNTFLVLALLDITLDDPIVPVIKALRATEGWEQEIARIVGKRKKRWRAIASVQNEPTAIPALWKQKLEKLMSAVPFLEPGSADADLTFWVLARREEFGLFGLRLTQRDDRRLVKGELRPELAHLLCLLSGPAPTDVFLDPFAGSGAIPAERAAAFPYARILAGDHDAALAARLRQRFARIPRVQTGSWDARALEGIADASVDAIVTDPPWGKFENIADLPTLYRTMIAAFRRVLKPNGRLVVLAPRDETLERAAHGSFRILETHDVLVSGQKSRIFLLHP